MMRVVHVSYYPDRDFFNAESWLQKAKFYNGVLEALAAKMDVHDVKVINYSGVMSKNGVKHHFLKSGKAFLPFRINNYVKKLKPDVVLVAGLLFPLQVALLRKQIGNEVKIVVQHHAEKPLGGLKAVFQKMADRYIDHYLFASKGIGKDWVAAKLVDSKKLREVMEASSFFYPMDKNVARTFTKINVEKAYLWVGRLNDNKDPLTAVKGFAEFSKANAGARLFMIYGENAMQNEVEAAIRQTDAANNIQLIGKVSNEEMLYWYNSVDYIISTSHYEGSGIAVCEAMSCGCIPLLTRISSFTMMSNEGDCGILFEKGDAQSLTDALSKTLILNTANQKNKVLQFYNKKLSYGAIAEGMEAVFFNP